MPACLHNVPNYLPTYTYLPTYMRTFIHTYTCMHRYIHTHRTDGWTKVGDGMWGAWECDGARNDWLLSVTWCSNMDVLYCYYYLRIKCWNLVFIGMQIEWVLWFDINFLSDFAPTLEYLWRKLMELIFFIVGLIMSLVSIYFLCSLSFKVSIFCLSSDARDCSHSLALVKLLVIGINVCLFPF
jgi:hypothetical protein